MKFLTSLTLATSVFATGLQLEQYVFEGMTFDASGMFSYLDSLDDTDNVIKPVTWIDYMEGVPVPSNFLGDFNDVKERIRLGL